MRTDDLRTGVDTWTAAARQPRRRREFPEHLVPHLAVIATLWVSWLVVALGTGTWFPWPLFPMAGWGIGLAFRTRSAAGSRSQPIGASSAVREMDRPEPRR